MRANGKIGLAGLGVFSTMLAFIAISLPVAAQCVDYSKDPAGCQPSAFRTPLDQMPTVRIDRQGQPDPKASEADVRAGALLLEKKLHLYRSFEHLHWVPVLSSVKDSVTGAWKDGDLDGAGTGRGFAIGGNCIFAGHNTPPGVRHPMNILKIQPNPEKQPPVLVGEIPIPVELDKSRGTDDKELRALVYQVAPGEDRMILVRLVGDRMETYRIDVATCQLMAKGVMYEGVGRPHEFFLWHDPANRKRVLIYVSMSGGGLPDPEHPGMTISDAYVFAATDENTGEILPKSRVLAGFNLHDVGGPPAGEKPDDTGLFGDGRFADYSHLKNRRGEPGDYRANEGNTIHSLSVSDDGERVYIAGGTAGFYVLNSEAVARHRDADFAAGTAGCTPRSTVVLVNGVIDASKLAQVANDCLHMVVNDDPGLKAFLGFASPDAKIQRYLTLLTRSRFDPYPPMSAIAHSAVRVPNRPAQVRGNSKGRPAYVFLTSENFGCPSAYARLISVEVETTPVMVGAFVVPDNELEECLDLPTTQPDGQPRPAQLRHSHNPTVFKNLVFLGHLVNGVRVIDISRPQTPREVGHAINVPSGNRQGPARGYTVFKDGLMYWLDIGNGLHVAKYTGPRSDEVPGPGSGIYDGNSTSPHR